MMVLKTMTNIMTMMIMIITYNKVLTFSKVGYIGTVSGMIPAVNWQKPESDGPEDLCRMAEPLLGSVMCSVGLAPPSTLDNCRPPALNTAPRETIMRFSVTHMLMARHNRCYLQGYDLVKMDVNESVTH